MYLQLGAVSIPRPPLIAPPGYLLQQRQPVPAPSQLASMHFADVDIVDEGEDVARDASVWKLIGK